MNFLGHAAVAAWSARDPAWIFGSMLPDFASMSRARRVGSANERITAGIAHHHATDAVFHTAPTFVAIHDGGTRELEARGVRRGPARAVSHVGTELLLDGFLLRDADIRATYLEAIRLDAPRLRLESRSPDATERLHGLLRRLRHLGIPEGYGEVAGVVDRLERTLRGRTRLAWVPAERPAIVAWLGETHARLRSEHGTLMGEVRAGLEQR